MYVIRRSLTATHGHRYPTRSQRGRLWFMCILASHNYFSLFLDFVSDIDHDYGHCGCASMPAWQLAIYLSISLVLLILLQLTLPIYNPYIVHICLMQSN